MGPADPPRREECVWQRGPGRCCAGDFPSAGFPQDTPAPASALERGRGLPGEPGASGPCPQSPRDLRARQDTALGTGHTWTAGGQGRPVGPPGRRPHRDRPGVPGSQDGTPECRSSPGTRHRHQPLRLVGKPSLRPLSGLPQASVTPCPGPPRAENARPSPQAPAPAPASQAWPRPCLRSPGG